MVGNNLMKLFNHDDPHQIWKYIYLSPIYWKLFRCVLDRWKSINEPEIHIICLNPVMNVSNFTNCNMLITFKPPLSSVERDWASMIAEQRQWAQQNVAELCRSVMSPPWGVTECAEAQTIVARLHQSRLRISKTASRRSTTVVERRWRQPVATQPPVQFALRSMATHGGANTLNYNWVQLMTLDRAPWQTDISPALDGGSFEHFKTSVRPPPLLAPSGAQRHSPTVVSVLCGAQLRSFTVFEPPLSADKNRQCVIVAFVFT